MIKRKKDSHMTTKIKKGGFQKKIDFDKITVPQESVHFFTSNLVRRCLIHATEK